MAHYLLPTLTPAYWSGMSRQNGITEAIISLIGALEQVVRRFGDRLEGAAPQPAAATPARRGPGRPRKDAGGSQPAASPPQTGSPRRGPGRPRKPLRAGRAGKSDKLRSAIAAHWASMTPEERAARVAKMRAGRTKASERGTT
jgi:hypothetical protein